MKKKSYLYFGVLFINLTVPNKRIGSSVSQCFRSEPSGSGVWMFVLA
jgi:hypothetical protein